MPSIRKVLRLDSNLNKKIIIILKFTEIIINITYLVNNNCIPFFHIYLQKPILVNEFIKFRIKLIHFLINMQFLWFRCN